jgi:Protein of unknown function (DUF2849)
VTSPSQQKLRVVGPTVVTANRLRDGKVLYRAANEGWTTRLEAAAVVTTIEAARQLLAAAAREDTNAINPYAAPVVVRDGRIEPGNLRERIRSAGPTFALPTIRHPADSVAETNGSSAPSLTRSFRIPSGLAAGGAQALDTDGFRHDTEDEARSKQSIS